MTKHLSNFLECPIILNMNSGSEVKQFENSCARKDYFNHIKKNWTEFAELLGLC